MSDLRLPDLNVVYIAGRLTRDPELKYGASGMAFCTLGLANTRYFKRKDGSRDEVDTFVDVKLFDKQAEWVGERLRKGRPVLVEGRLQMDQWEDKATGQKRSKITILAQRVTPLDWDESERNSAPRPASGSGGYGSDRGGASRPAAPQRPAYEPTPRDIEEPIPEDDIPF